MSAFDEKQKLWDEFPKFSENYKWPNKKLRNAHYIALCIAVAATLCGAVIVVFGEPVFVWLLLLGIGALWGVLSNMFCNDAALIVVSPDGYLVRQWEPKLRVMLVNTMLNPDMYAIVLRVRDGKEVDCLLDQPWKTVGGRSWLFQGLVVKWVESDRLVVHRGTLGDGRDIVVLVEVCAVIKFLLSREAFVIPDEFRYLFDDLHNAFRNGEDVRLILCDLQRQLRFFNFMRTEAQREREHAFGDAIGFARKAGVERLYMIVDEIAGYDRFARSVQGLAFKLSLLGKISAFYHNDTWMVDVPEGGKAAAIMRWNELCDAYPHGELADTIKQTQQEYEAAQRADAQSRSKPPKSKKKEADPVQPT